MNIKIERGNAIGLELVIEAENVKISYDIEAREYDRDINGKLLSVFPKRDVSTDALDKFTKVLDDMIYYREAEYDSSDLIKRLFEKLPSDVASKLHKFLEDTYDLES
jgi:hypothetical protein